MPENIEVYKKDEVYMKVVCDRGAAMEISDNFTFEVPGAKFMPEVRNKMWDGKIRLFNVNKNQLYVGLLSHLKEFCESRDYNLIVHDGLDETADVPLNLLEEYLNKCKYNIMDHQLRAVAHAIRNHRALILSPTASGKSFIIFSIIRFYKKVLNDPKVLIVVPTTSLVSQMNTDFIDYSQGCKAYSTHLIMSGQAKDCDNSEIFISTWQSIYKQPKKWFDQFDVVIGDEAHLFKARSLVSIMEKLTDCKYRFGFTGTLDGTKTNKLVLEGLFGKVMKVINTKELIDKDILSSFKIKCLCLKYATEECKEVSKMKYQDEMDFLVNHVKRNSFIKNLTLTRTGNTLLLYQYVEKHGEVLYKAIKAEAEEGRKVFFVSGKTDTDTREAIRAATEKEDNAIIVASYGTYSTGINIKNLHNVIFASPSKSRVRNLQSIGRGLRKGDNKDSATLYDISDNLAYKSKLNHTVKHYMERVKIYAEEEFEYKTYNIRLSSD